MQAKRYCKNMTSLKIFWQIQRSLILTISESISWGGGGKGLDQGCT